MPTTADPQAVPLNVWLADHDAPTAAALRHRLIRRLVETYSPTGGAVVELVSGDGGVRAAAGAAGRRVICPRRAPTCAGGRHSPSRNAPAVSADLAMALPPASHLRPPRPHPLSSSAAAVLCRRAATLLRPGGFLVLGTLGRNPRSGRDPISGAVVGASDAGLGYYQHLVVLLDAGLDPAGTEAGRPRRQGHADLVVFARTAR
jgi:hypothetical protein